MSKKFLLVLFVLLFTILACNLPGTIPSIGVTDTPETPGGTGITPDVVLPPPPLPSFLQVVYVKGGNLWRWTEGAALIQLTSSGSDSSPRISDDGQVVAFLHGEELWAVNTDGSNLRQLVSTAYLASLVPPAMGRGVIHWFEWDPFFHSLVFGTSEAGEAYTIPVFDLHGVGADPVTPPILLEMAGLGGVATYSPNGTMIAMAQATKIILMNRDGSGYRDAMTFDMVSTYSEWLYIPEVVWFADSSEFRTVIPAHDPLANPSEGTYFWSIPVSGSPTDMAGFTAVPAFHDFPRISPDGLNVAYMSPNGTDSELHLNGFYIGDELFSYYPVDQWGLVGWAPDSNGFVYWADDVRSLWFGHIGSAAVPLTDTALAQDLRWIDITRILFVSGGELRLGAPGGASSVIDSGVSGGYDFDN